MALAKIEQGHLTQAQFDANPTFILGDGQIVWLKDNSGKFKKGDGVTDLSALPFLGISDIEVKLSENITKGQAVYISSANGTNIIVSKASNATEATSSKTLGLLETTGVTNDILYVITEGMLGGLNTSTATIGDAVWLGTSGNLIFGLASKPVAPAHLVYIGVVSRVHAVNGEILVKVQNGFELNEIHDVLTSANVTTPVDADNLLIKENSSGLWKSLSWSNLTSNLLTKQTIQITSSTAPTVSVNGYRRTFVDITALAGNINLSTNLTGSPQNGDVLLYQIKDNGTARTITMGSLFEAKGEALPTTTVISKRINIGATWDSTTNKWGVIAVAQEV